MIQSMIKCTADSKTEIMSRLRPVGLETTRDLPSVLKGSGGTLPPLPIYGNSLSLYPLASMFQSFTSAANRQPPIQSTLPHWKIKLKEDLFVVSITCGFFEFRGIEELHGVYDVGRRAGLGRAGSAWANSDEMSTATRHKTYTGSTAFSPTKMQLASHRARAGTAYNSPLDTHPLCQTPQPDPQRAHPLCHPPHHPGTGTISVMHSFHAANPSIQQRLSFAARTTLMRPLHGGQFLLRTPMVPRGMIGSARSASGRSSESWQSGSEDGWAPAEERSWLRFSSAFVGHLASPENAPGRLQRDWPAEQEFYEILSVRGIGFICARSEGNLTKTDRGIELFALLEQFALRNQS
ncbi:hypothetical protein B0H17DRAFT_1134924 [Mycena rosella]|uniref:Uncharacterized protein n=1 Tax=Mycena rosella TaxID=1033263 RepID=A0AAD7DGA6_MYCRO|nr:hypothetical protein B0H17DRAFT_1134924 [Mycena rosella]